MSQRGTKTLIAGGYKYGLRRSNASNPIYVTSKYKSKLIELDGYRYGLHVAMGPKQRWRCVRQGNGCKAVLIIMDDTIVCTRNEHNHPCNIYTSVRKT